MNGERVDDVTTHPAFRPIVDVRARIYDMAHEAEHRDDAHLRRGRRDVRPRPQAAAHAGGLAGQARGGRRGDERDRRRRDPRRRRDHRRDVVALRRPGRAERGRPALRREHRAAHRPRPARGPVPRLGQHRSEGRPLEAAAGSGSGHAAARREGDRLPASSSAAPSTRRPRPTPTRRSSSRRSPTGATTSSRTTRSGSSSTWARPAQAHLPHRLRRPRADRRLSAVEPLRRGRHADRLRRRAGAVGERAVLPAHPRRDVHPRRRCTATARSRSSSASCTSPTC